MTQKRFEFLVEQYKHNQLSQAEWEELRKAVREGIYDDWLTENFRQEFDHDGRHASWTPGLKEEIWLQILPMLTNQKKTYRLPSLIRYAAAAALLILLTGLWLFRPKPKPALLVAKTFSQKNELPPGGDKALLILADGTHIELDSAKNGLIARQGMASFHKSNGALLISLPALSRQSAVQGAGEAVITTPRGGQYQLMLPDGSKVWLNSASSLRFPTVFSGRERSVELSGEGYFEIAKNAEKPFTVNVNHMKVRVLGTHFNTMAYPDEKTINTTLLQGAVIVSEGDLSRQLMPGQQALLNSAGHNLAVGKADIQKAIAWKNGLFEFDHTDLATIMRQLARWYDIEIIYQVRPDNTPLGGSISRNLGLTEVLNLLEANGINHFKIEGRKVFVLP